MHKVIYCIHYIYTPVDFIWNVMNKESIYHVYQLILMPRNLRILILESTGEYNTSNLLFRWKLKKRMDECSGEKKRNGGYNIHVVVIWKNKDFCIS